MHPFNSKPCHCTPLTGEAERPPSFSPEDAQDTGGADEDPLDCALDEVIGEAHAYGHPSRWSCPPSPGLHIPTYPGTPGDHPAVGNDDQAFAASLLEHLQVCVQFECEFV